MLFYIAQTYQMAPLLINFTILCLMPVCAHMCVSVHVCVRVWLKCLKEKD